LGRLAGRPGLLPPEELVFRVTTSVVDADVPRSLLPRPGRPRSPAQYYNFLPPSASTGTAG